MPLKHYPFGGSTAARTIGCPGWRARADKLPPQGSSAAADKGSVLHDAMERIMMEGITDLKDVVGMEYNGQIITFEDIPKKIQPALNAVDDLFKAYGINDYAVEEEVTVYEDTGGTADLLASGPGTFICADYKFGDGIMVDAKDNKQGLFYIWCAMNTEDDNGDLVFADMFHDTDTFVIAIIQPSERRESMLDTWEVTKEEIVAFGDDMLTAISLAESGEDVIKEGSHCTFCPVAPTCPVKLANAEKASSIALEEVKFSPSDIAELMSLANSLEPWIRAVNKMAFDALDTGQNIEGWKLVAKRASRSWIDPGDAERYLKRTLKADVATVKKVITPAQAEIAAKELGLTNFDIERLCQKKSSGNTLVPESDKRHAITPNALGEAMKKLK